MSFFTKFFCAFFFSTFLFFVGLNCSHLPFPFIDSNSSSTDGFNGFCLVNKIYNQTCPGCSLELTTNSTTISFHSGNSLKNPSTQDNPSPQPWKSNGPETIYIEFPFSYGTMVLSQGLLFEFKDNLSNIYGNFDDSFQLDQSETNLNIYDSKTTGTFSGSLKNKANSSDIISVSGNITDAISDYNFINCSNGV